MFRERYRLSPSELRRSPRRSRLETCNDLIRLTLGYRPPFNWEALLESLAGTALPGVEQIQDATYSRTVRLAGHTGVILVRNHAEQVQLNVDISTSLLPALMPLLARLRQLFDLDADPLSIEFTLEQHGLAAEVRARAGLRLPGAMDGFEAVMGELVPFEVRGRLVESFGEAIETTLPGLSHLSPEPSAIIEAGASRLVDVGLSPVQVEALVAVARMLRDRTVHLQPGCDAPATAMMLARTPGISEATASAIVSRALSWPDAFPAVDSELALRAEAWRPWRGYAAMYLRLVGAIPEDARSASPVASQRLCVPARALRGQRAAI